MTEPTCLDEGYTTFTCACGSSFTANYVDALGHIYTSYIVEPTCTEEGYEFFECHCGLSYYRDNYVPQLGHDWGDWFVEKEATETETGIEKCVCNNCGEELTLTIPKNDHVHIYDTVVVTDPTCEEQGYTTYTCICGEFYTNNFVDALDHDWGGWFVIEEPTAEKDGKEKNVCRRCAKEEVRSVLFHIHSYEAVITEPTCTDQGYTTYTCSCRDSYVDNYVEALGHEPSEWQEDPNRKADCENTGWRIQKCVRCDFIVRGETVSAYGHDYVCLENKVSDDGEYASNYYECSVCGETSEEHSVSIVWEELSEGRMINDSLGQLYPGVRVKIDIHSFMDELLTQYIQYELLVKEEYKPYVSLTEDNILCVSDEIADTELPSLYFKMKVSLADNPLNAKLVDSLSNNNVHLRFVSFTYVGKEYVEMDRKIQTVLLEIITDDMNEGEKILAVHNWICDNVYYDDDTYEAMIDPSSSKKIDPESVKAYGAIVDGKAVCSGYAKAFQEFMWRLDIPVGYVTSQKINHAWNIVMLDDEWYWLDTTWDDCEVVFGSYYNYKYFLRGGIRAQDQVCYEYPEGLSCTGFKWRRKVFERYYAGTEEDIIRLLSEQKDNKESYLVFHTSAESDIFENGLAQRYKDTYNSALLVNTFFSSGEGEVDGIYYEDYQVYIIYNTDRFREFITTEISK